jgi:hypothetical protein
MRILLAVTALLLVSGCGGTATESALDPSASGGPGGGMPTSVPAAPGEVTTRGVVTIVDTGDGPELCLGPVAESSPPQCSGPPVTGWDWATHEQTYEQWGPVRWGSFALTGRWDGTTFTAAGAIPSALYDAAGRPEPAYRTPAERHSRTELERIAREVGGLPGEQAAAVRDERVLVGVTYDDGSLQRWADRAYGEGVVAVVPLLLDEP